MNTTTLKTAIRFKAQKEKMVPKTGRGRALYTVDWFTNGTPVLRNHDHSRITLTSGFTC